MSDCWLLSDRMPAVALGGAGWSADETRHLSSCTSCQKEWELVRRSSRLGSEIGSGLDSEATTRAVLQRLKQHRQEQSARRRAWSFAAVAAAAAIAAAVWTGRPVTRPAEPPNRPLVAGRLRIPLPELDNLKPAELNAVLQTIDEPNGGGSVDTPGSGDLDDEELDAVLDTWEG